ncbi:MAG: MotA/TolQ/ExbB proton channel family protein [Bacteroidota bacterium]
MKKKVIPYSLLTIVIITGVFSIKYQFEFLYTLILFLPEYEVFLIAGVLAVLTFFINRYRVYLQKAVSITKEGSNKNILYISHVNFWESIVLGILLTGIIYLILFSIDASRNAFIETIIEKLARRGSIPILTMTLFSTALVICFFKLLITFKIKRQFDKINTQLSSKKAKFNVEGGVLSSFLNNRIAYIQSEDSDEGPEYFAALDREELGSSYTFAQFILWSIPVMGFIGTVWGIGESIGGFTFALGQASVDGLSSELLRPSLRYLSVAFDTTLVALSVGIIAMLVVSFMHRTEEKLLTSCHLLFARKSIYHTDSTTPINTYHEQE